MLKIVDNTEPVGSRFPETCDLEYPSGHDIHKAYDNLFNNPFIGIFKCLMADGAIVTLNEKAADILALDPGRDQKVSLFDIFKNSADKINILLNKVREYSHVDNYQIEHFVNDRKKWISLSCKYNPGDNLLEGFITDITDQKLQEQKLQALREELDLFIYHASHELKSPLTTILGAAYLLRRDKSNEDAVDEYSDMIADRARHLECLFKELTHIYSNSQTDIKQEPIDFYAILNPILRDMGPRHPRVHINYDLSLNVPFNSDPDRIYIILKNLLSNAFKFHSPSSVCPLLFITIVTDHRHATISIQDNGIGMDTEKYQRDIFKVFFRGSEISKRGFGIGLYLVKSITDKLGGTVEVNAAIGSGSTFTIKIPNRQSAGM